MESFGGTERFHVLRQLGEGGMGVVYEALDREQGVRVALKRLHARSDPGALLRLKQEFRALRDVRHTHLVSLGELVETNGEWFFTMELVEGPAFLSYVRDDRRPAPAPVTVEPRAAGHEGQVESTLPMKAFDSTDMGAVEVTSPQSAPAPELSLSSLPTEACRPIHTAAREAPRFREARLRAVLSQLASGLAALHDAGKVHRDIKPQNLLLRPDGHLVISDFGLVSDVMASRGVPDFVSGTPAYMAPELLSSLDVMPASDWYSVGVVLYRALTGALPFEGSDALAFEQKRVGVSVSPGARAFGVPGDLEALCMALLDPTPSRRPGADEVMRVVGAPSERRGKNNRPPTGVARAFVGRTEELEQLRTWLDDALGASGPRTVVIQGESGVGKSALAQRLGADVLVARPDALWLSGRCHEREWLPYKALDGVIDQLTEALCALPTSEVDALLPQDAGVLCQLFPVMRQIEAVRRAARDGDAPALADSQERAFEALRFLFGRVARGRPVVLALDDVQWADPDSLAMLRQVLRATGSLAVVATVRAPPDVPWLPDGYGGVSLGTAGAARHLLLRPLSSDDARALAHSLAGELGRVVDVDAVALSAGGHPLFIEELLLHAHPAVDAQPLDDALHARTLALPSDARRLLALVALTGTPIGNEPLRAAAGLDAAAFVEARDHLERERLIRASGRRRADAVECYHDRIRETVAHRLEPDVKRALHLQLARALETVVDSRAADEELLATHWHGAGEGERALTYTLRAAARAEQALAFERAARLYRQAQALLPVDDARAGPVSQRLAASTFYAGRSREAAQLYLDAAGRAAGLEALVLRRHASEQLLHSGHFHQGLDVLQSTLRACGLALPSTRVGVLVSAAWQQLRVWLRGLEPLQRRAPETAQQRFVTELLCSAARSFALFNPILSSGFAARHLRRALDSGNQEQMFFGLTGEAMLLCAITGGESTRSRRMMEHADALARGNYELEGQLASARGMFELCFTGDNRAALDQCLRAETVMAEPGMFRDELAGTQYMASTALWYLGEWRRMRERRELQLPRAVEREHVLAHAWLCTGPMATVPLMDGKSAQARSDVHEVLGRWPREHFVLLHAYELLALGQIDLYEGSDDEALLRLRDSWRALSRSFLLRIPLIAHMLLGLRARAALGVAAREADGRTRERLLHLVRQNAEALRRLGIGIMGPHASLLLAQADAIAGDPTRARALADVEHELQAAGATLFAAGARIVRGRALGADGAALVDEGLAAFAAQGVADPARGARLVIADG